MMSVMAKFAPSAGDNKEIKGNKPGTKEAITFNSSSNDPLSAIVFKTISEEHIGEMSFFRVYSGKLNLGDDLQNTSRNQSEKMRQLYFMSGINRKDAPQLITGDIGAALKLKNTHTGDTLANSKNPISLPEIFFPTPTTSRAVKPKTRGDEEKIATGLSVLHEEDPSFIYRVDSELKQTIVSGQGELHLDIALKRISKRFNVELETEDITLISKINLLLGIALFNSENVAEARESFTQALSDKTTEEQAKWWLDHIKRKSEVTKNS